jgi:hypothetical protein
MSNCLLTQKEKQDLLELKSKMSKVRDVVEWNILRRQYKKTYTANVINSLDASGFIHTVLLKRFK